jgi:uncharacterized membrane protein
MTIQSIRSLGGIGSILVALGALSSVFSVIRILFPISGALYSGLSLIGDVISFVSFIGFILFLVAMYNSSRQYNEHKIFNYILYGIIATIAAGLILGIVFALFFLGSFLGGSSFSTTTMSSSIPNSLEDSLAIFMPVFGLVGLIYIGFTVKSLNLLSAKSQVPLFNTAAKVFLIGAVVQIVMVTVFAILNFSLDMYSVLSLPGGIIQYLAWALLAMAFFKINMPPTPIVTSSTIYSSSSASTAQTKYCIHCGAANSPDMIYCVKCGKKQ